MNNKVKRSIPKIQKQGTDFLLAEYEMLQRLRQGVVSADEGRLNFFIAIASGAIFSFTFLDQIAEYTVAVIIAGAIVVNLFLLGVLTFARSVERSIRIIVYTRGMNRIRRYFVENHLAIERFLILPTNDDYPRFGTVGNLSNLVWLEPAAIIAIINSVVATIGVAMLGGVVLKLHTMTNLLICIATFIIIFSIQHRYHIGRYRKTEKIMEVRFPSKSKRQE